MEQVQNFSVKPKSQFVTVFAWLMIAFTALSLFASLMQNILFAIFFRVETFKDTLSSIENIPPGWPLFLLKNIRVILPVMFIVFLFAFAASIGLLNRKKWARKAYLYMLGFGIFAIIGGTVLQALFINSMFSFGVIPNELVFIRIIMIVMMVIFAAAFIVLFGWLIKKLSSKEIRMEFEN